ncbi:hypothetical protein ACFPOA_15760 [Lysobacter niabensis]|uniref:hypothetical protein n=1 Tax=Agrilutibacter niabensis TaxID=380628 RepID=UPI00360826F1
METVRVVMVDALPLPGTEAFAEYGGATINIYSTEQSEDGALTLAAREVAEAGWQIQSVEDNFLLTRADLMDSPDGLQYFEQALVDGIVLVIYTYPADAADRNAIH